VAYHDTWEHRPRGCLGEPDGQEEWGEFARSAKVAGRDLTFTSICRVCEVIGAKLVFAKVKKAAPARKGPKSK
jgi:hypothetical protein